MQQVFRMRDADGEYDVPESEVANFRRASPNAVGVSGFRDKDGDYDVPDTEQENFKRASPDAQPIRRFRMDDGEDIDVDERAIARLRQGQMRNPFAPIGSDREAERASVSRKVWKEAGLPEKYGRSQKDRDEVSRLILNAYDNDTKAEEAARAARQNGTMAQLDATRPAFEAQFQRMQQTQREFDYQDALAKAEAERPDIGVFGHAYLNAVASAGRDVGEGELIMRQLPVLGAFIDANDAMVNNNFRRFMNGEFKDSLAMGNAARIMGVPEDVIADVQRRAWSGERTAMGAPIVDQKKAAEEWRKVIEPLYRAREAAKGRAVETLQEAAPLTATQEILSGAMTLPKMVVDLTPLGAGITALPKIATQTEGLVEKGDSEGTALAKSAASVGGEYFIWNKLGKVIDALPGVGNAVKSAGQALARNKVTGNVIARNAGQILEMNAKSGLTELVNDVVGMGKADGEEKKEFSEWFQDFVSVQGNAKKMLMMLPAHLLMKGVGKGKQLLSKEGREAAGAVDAQREIVKATIGEEAARGLSDADVQNIYKIVSSPNLTEKSISDTLSFIEGKAGTENRQGALRELRKQLREGRVRAENQEAARAGAEKLWGEAEKAEADAKAKEAHRTEASSENVAAEPPPAEPPKNGPTIAQGEEGTTTPPNGAEPPQGGKSAENGTAGRSVSADTIGGEPQTTQEPPATPAPEPKKPFGTGDSSHGQGKYSRKNYDGDAANTGATGAATWHWQNGERVYSLPVDFSQTRPGGPVVLDKTDSAYERIKELLNGRQLVMTKSGKIQFKGEFKGAVPKELRELLGRELKIGKNPDAPSKDDLYGVNKGQFGKETRTTWEEVEKAVAADRENYHNWQKRQQRADRRASEEKKLEKKVKSGKATQNELDILRHRNMMEDYLDQGGKETDADYKAMERDLEVLQESGTYDYEGLSKAKDAADRFRDAEWENAIGEIESGEGDFSPSDQYVKPFTRENLQGAKKGDIIHFDHDEVKYELDRYDPETGVMDVYRSDENGVKRRFKVSRNGVEEIRHDGKGQKGVVQDNAGDAGGGGRPAPGAAGGEARGAEGAGGRPAEGGAEARKPADLTLETGEKTPWTVGTKGGVESVKFTSAPDKILTSSLKANGYRYNAKARTWEKPTGGEGADAILGRIHDSFSVKYRRLLHDAGKLPVGKASRAAYENIDNFIADTCRIDAGDPKGTIARIANAIQSCFDYDKNINGQLGGNINRLLEEIPRQIGMTSDADLLKMYNAVAKSGMDTSSASKPAYHILRNLQEAMLSRGIDPYAKKKGRVVKPKKYTREQMSGAYKALVSEEYAKSHPEHAKIAGEMLKNGIPVSTIDTTDFKKDDLASWPVKGMRVHTKEDAANLCRMLSNPYFEVSKLLFVDKDGNVISGMITDIGLSGSTKAKLEGLEKIIPKGAYGVIASHNHPLGNVNPSGADRRVLVRQQEAFNKAGIKFLDHIITDTDDFYSMGSGGHGMVPWEMGKDVSDWWKASQKKGNNVPSASDRFAVVGKSDIAYALKDGDLTGALEKVARSVSTHDKKGSYIIGMGMDGRISGIVKLVDRKFGDSVEALKESERLILLTGERPFDRGKFVDAMLKDTSNMKFTDRRLWGVYSLADGKAVIEPDNLDHQYEFAYKMNEADIFKKSPHTRTDGEARNPEGSPAGKPVEKSIEKPAGKPKTVADEIAELDRLIAEEESGGGTSGTSGGSGAEGLPSRSQNFTPGPGVKGGPFTRLVSKNSIIRSIRDNFPEFAIRGKNTTRMGKNYEGHFEPWRELIRSKDMSSIDTIPHEIGHGISMLTKRRGMKIPLEVKRELARWGRDLYSGLPRPSGGYMEEGFAEYVRGYMTGAEDLATQAPKLDKWFRDVFAKDNPDYVRRMDAVRTEVMRWKAQNDVQKVAAMMNPDTSAARRAWERVKSVFTQEAWNDEGATLTKAYKKSGLAEMHKWQGEFRELEKLVKAGQGNTQQARDLAAKISEKILSDPRIFASNARGTSKARVLDMAKYGITNLTGTEKIGNVTGFDANGKPIRDNVTESYRDIFGGFTKKELADFDVYAAAKIGLENYIKQGKEYGADRGVLERTVAQLETPKFLNALERFTAFSRRALSVGLEAGALTPEQYQQIVGAHKYYVRTERRLADDGAGAGGRQANPIKAIKGSTRNILPPRTATLMQIERQLRYFQTMKVLNMIARDVEAAEAQNERFFKSGGKDGAEYRIGANLPLKVTNATGAVKFKSEKLREDVTGRMTQAGVAADKAEADRLFNQLFSDGDDVLTVFKERPSNGKNGLVSTYIDGKLVTFELPDRAWERYITGMEKGEGGFDNKVANAIWNAAITPGKVLRLGATTLNPVFALANFERDTMHSAIMSETGAKPLVSSVIGMMSDVLGKDAGRLFKSMGGEMSMLMGSNPESQMKHVSDVALANGFAGQIMANTSLMNPLRGFTQVTADTLSKPEIGPRVRELMGVLARGKAAGISREASAWLAFAAGKDISIDFGKHGYIMKRLNQLLPYTNAWYRGLEQFARNFGMLDALPTQFEERRGVRAAKTAGKALMWLTATAVATNIAKMLMSDDNEKRAQFKKTEREKWDYDDVFGVRVPLPFELGSVFYAIPKAIVYESFGDKGAVREALWHAISSNLGKYAEVNAWFPTIMSPFIDNLRNEKWDYSPVVAPQVKENFPKDKQMWYDHSTTSAARWVGEKLGWAPAHIDHVMNTWSGGMWKRFLSPSADSSIANLTGVSAFKPRPTARRDVRDFYDFREEAQSHYNAGNLGPEDYGRLKRANKLHEELAPMFKEMRELSESGLSSDERRKRREEIMDKVFDKIHDWSVEDANDRKLGVAKAAESLTASTDITDDVRDRSLAVLKGVSPEEARDALREYGREVISVPVRNGNGKKTGRMKRQRRWSSETIAKRLKRLNQILSEHE